MKNLISIFLLLVLGIISSSCTPSAPYEIRSPCVSDDSGDLSISPCPRRAVNQDRLVI